MGAGIAIEEGIVLAEELTHSESLDSALDRSMDASGAAASAWRIPRTSAPGSRIARSLTEHARLPDESFACGCGSDLSRGFRNRSTA